MSAKQSRAQVAGRDEFRPMWRILLKLFFQRYYYVALHAGGKPGNENTLAGEAWKRVITCLKLALFLFTSWPVGSPW